MLACTFGWSRRSARPPAPGSAPAATRPPWREEARRLWRRLRGGELSAPRAAVAVALGLFVGALPLYGLHLPLVLLVCVPLRVDAPIAYLAANISNPLVAPFLLVLEVQTGALLRTGAAVPFTAEGARATGAAGMAAHLLVGAPVVGAALALVGGTAIWLGGRLASRRGRAAPARSCGGDALRRAAERTAARYAPHARAGFARRAAPHYVRAKLGSDPAARLVAALAAVDGGLGHVLDVGCGRGQLAVFLLEAGRAAHVHGVDWDERKIALAREASRGLAATFSVGDVREAELPHADTVLLLDVLHYLKDAEQDELLRRAAHAVRPGGLLLVREADGARGLRTVATRLEEGLFTLLRWNRGERVRFRPIASVVAACVAEGFSCEVVPAWGATPFSNVLVVARRAGGPPP